MAIRVPGKTLSIFSHLFFYFIFVEGFLRELLNLLWTNDFVTKKYAGIDETKTKRGGSKQLLRFLWFLTNKGQGTQWAADVCAQMNLEENTVTDLSNRFITHNSS